MKRITSIDFVRGLVMIIMALDHVRDFTHINASTQSPTDLATTTPALFFTRWITYLCAPTFVFLAGTSAYISFKNQNNLSKSRAFLLKRGIWLILLEFTLVNFALWFDLGFHNFIFEVIAAIGFGFIILSLMLKLPIKIVGVIGIIIIFFHNLLPLIPFAEGSIIKTFITPFFGMAVYPIISKTILIIGYPPIPWLGIMLAGFATGQLFELNEIKRNNLFMKIGIGAILLFIILRFINIYGDPSVWALQKDGLFTFLSFMNITKYPPSLLFCLITLGIMFLKLSYSDKINGRIKNIAIVYGKVPLFYFLIHFYLAHIIMVCIIFSQGFHWADMDFASGSFGRPKGVQSGVELWLIYVIWLGIVVALYPVCKWYGNYKMVHKEKTWLRYL